MKKWMAAITGIVSLMFLIACSVPATDGNNNNNSDAKKVELSITLPGAPVSKAVYSQDDAKSYKIVIENNLVVVDSKTGLPGETVKFELAEEGVYKITVLAYDENGKEIAKGSVEKNLKYGFGVIPVNIEVKPYQKAIEIVTDITWKNDYENQIMNVEYSKTGNGIDITIKAIDPKYGDIRFYVSGGDSENTNFLCYMNQTVAYPVTFNYPFVEDGKEYIVTYYCQTDGTEENREIYEEEHKVVAKGGLGEIVPVFDSSAYSITGENVSESIVYASINYTGNGTEPSLFLDNPLFDRQYGVVEVAKGTNDWGPLTVWKSAVYFDLDSVTSEPKATEVSGISNGDTYFVQSMTEYYLKDSEKYPFKIRTLGIQSENLTWD